MTTSGSEPATSGKPGAIAEAFTADRWQPPREEQRGVEIRLPSDTEPDVVTEAQQLCAGVLEFVCDALNLPFEAPRAATTPRVDGYEIAIGGAVRFVGAFETTWMSWWSQRPAGGAGGRSGVAPGPNETAGELDLPHQIARALEEVAWDDPSLLLGAEGALASGILPYPSGFDPASWTSVLSALSARRIPLDPDAVTTSVRQVDPRTPPAVWLEQLAFRLRPYEIVIRLGAELYDELEPQNPGAPLLGELLPYLHGELFRELGVGFSEVSFSMASALPSHAFEILVGELRRAGGSLPPASSLVNSDPAIARMTLGSTNEPPGVINPASGSHDSWVEGDRITAFVGDVVTWDAAGFVILQLAAILREAAAEFADLAWTQQTFEQLRELGDADLVALLDKRYSRETIAATFHRLAAEGVSLRDLPLILERMLDYAVVRGGDGSDVLVDDVALAEHARRGSRRRLVQDAIFELTWDAGEGDAPLRRAMRHIDTISLDVRTEALLAGALQGRRPEHVYSLPQAAAILDALRRELDGRAPGQGPALVVPTAVRPHVRRLIAAQFPRVRVFAREELPPDIVESNVLVEAAAAVSPR